MNRNKSELVAQLGLAILEKRAQEYDEDYSVSREELARLMAGQGEPGMVEPERIDQYKQERLREGTGIGAASGGIGGLMLGGALGGVAGGLPGAALGATAGGGLGAGIGALRGRQVGRARGEYEGQGLSEGELPYEVPAEIPSSYFAEYAQDEYPTYESEGMSPEEYEQMRSNMRRQHAGRGAVHRGLTWGIPGVLAAGPAGGAVIGGIGAASGAASGVAAGTQEADLVRELESQGYSQLAERLRSRGERGVF
jgi:hypothetical protein